MSKYSMKAGSDNAGSNADWEGFNQELKEKIGELDSRIGIISGIVDLGIQTMPDTEFEYKGDASQQKLLSEDKVEKYGNHIRTDEDGKEWLVLPQKPCRNFAILADFPEIDIDYGKFFSEDGESQVRPYRHILNGEWFKMIDGKRYNVVNLKASCNKKENKDKVWTFGEKSYIAKLAKACGVADQVLDAQMDVGYLMEEYCMFPLGVEEKNGYINVKIESPAPKHKSIPDPEWNATPCFINFFGENDEESLKTLKASVKNTMAMARNFKDSDVRKQLEALGNDFSKFSSFWVDDEEGEGKQADEPRQAPPEAPQGDDDAPY